MLSDARAVLAREDVKAENRVLDAFDTIFGKIVGSESLDELFATIVELNGPKNVRELQDELTSEVARILHSAGIAKKWKNAGVSAQDLAELLFAASDGIKRRARTRDEFRDRMSIAVRLVCRGASE